MNRTRLFAFAGLLLIGFNSIGYYAVLLLIEKQVSFRINQKIDDHISVVGSNLLITFPIENTYVPDTEYYERSEGQIIFEGVVYQKVKQKVYHHTLYVLCVKDNESTKIHEVADEYSRTITNQQPESSDATLKIVVSLAKYFINPGLGALRSAMGWSCDLLFAPADNSYTYLGSSSVFHPPLSLA